MISLSPDLKQLQDEGYKIEILDNYLLVHQIPYVNPSSEVSEGVLVTDLDMAGNKTVKPRSHVIHFIGEHPCNKDGSEIKSIKHGSATNRLTNSITVNHSFSNRPKPDGYKNYHHKVTRYIEIISAPAISLDDSKTAKVFEVIETNEDESVFNYMDSNSSRAEIGIISSKLERYNIGIIGLGGTGSYVLDQIAKTPVAQIHLFDGDVFLQHNAFRSPGAPSIEELQTQPFKTDYFKRLYSKMHRGIISHPEYLNTSNIQQIDELDFIFLCIDIGSVKKMIIDRLLKSKIPFIDVGLDVHRAEDKLLGTVRSTLVTKSKRDHYKSRITLSDIEEGDDIYSKNIQISDLNALNALFAVIKWKKHVGFYQDMENEYSTIYSTNVNELYNEDH